MTMEVIYTLGFLFLGCFFGGGVLFGKCRFCFSSLLSGRGGGWESAVGLGDARGR